MTTWWERYPDVYRREVEALDQAGIDYDPPDANKQTGILTIYLRYPMDNGLLPLVALFPAEYPYFPVHVNAPDLELVRHQNPLNRNLCLLGNPSEDWSVHDTLVDLLQRQLGRVIRTAVEPDSEYAESNETHQGEPWSAYVPYEYGHQLVVGNLEIPPEVEKGRLIWVKERNSKNSPAVRGVLLEVLSSDKEVIARPEPWLEDRYSNLNQLEGKWRRVEGLPEIKDPEKHFMSVYPLAINKKGINILKRLYLVGTLYREETQWRDYREGWIFSAFIPGSKKQPGKYFFLRAGQANEKELFARTPEFYALRNKHILIIGLGMLGSPAALQFARAGVGKLTLCDGDYVELGTIPRWALGWEASARSKAIFLKEHIERQYPYVQVDGVEYSIGNPFYLSEHREKLVTALNNADLVFDAAADACVSNYVRLECLRRSIPHVWIETNPGCWGGVVGRCLPERTGCWACMKYFQDEEDDKKRIPIPEHKQDDTVQPAGCRTPTGTGAGFDSDVVVLEGVRMAMGILSEGETGGYPMTDWDVGIVDLRSSDGNLQVPSWKTFELPVHSQCCHV